LNDGNGAAGKSGSASRFLAQIVSTTTATPLTAF